MREATRSASAAGRATRLRSVLVVGEFALALVLLVGAALLVQSFWRLQRVDLGFNPSSVLTARLWLPQPNVPETGPYFTHDARVSFYRRVLERVAALPGVQAVGGISNLPLGGATGRTSFTIEGRAPTAGRRAKQRSRAGDARLLRRPRRRSPAAASSTITTTCARPPVAS